MANLTENEAKEVLGTAGAKAVALGIAQSEFLPELRGMRGLQKFREMRDNDSVVGALMYAIDMLLRAVPVRCEPAQEDDSRAVEYAEFAESLLHDMEHSWDEALTNALTILTYGWSALELVTKRRGGSQQEDPEQHSKFSDGLIGIRRLAPRPQDTLDRWVYEDDELVAFRQRKLEGGGTVDIPMSKLLHFRTTNINDSPMGRSVLRNAYKPYYFASHIETIEAIAIERELNGLPVAYMPSSYLRAQSGTDEARFRDEVLKILRDIKRNEQAAAIFPSDPYYDGDGAPTNNPMFRFELVASEGSRDIDTSKVITRYRQDIARTVLADFLMLGSMESGSFALSKDKSALFTKSLEGFLEAIAGVLNRQMLPQMWAINGLPAELMPKYSFGAVAPVDLEALGDYVQRLAGAGFAIFPDPILESELLEAADLPSDHRESLDADLMGLSDEDDGDQG